MQFSVIFFFYANLLTAKMPKDFCANITSSLCYVDVLKHSGQSRNLTQGSFVLNAQGWLAMFQGLLLELRPIKDKAQRNTFWYISGTETEGCVLITTKIYQMGDPEK